MSKFIIQRNGLENNNENINMEKGSKNDGNFRMRSNLRNRQLKMDCINIAWYM